MNVFQLSRQFKAQLLAREKKAALEMLRRYHDVYASINAQAEALAAQIDAEIKAGRSVSQAWLFKERRLQTLLAQTKVQMAQFGAYAGSRIKQAKYEEAIRAQREAHLLTKAALGKYAQVAAAWDQLPTGALESIVGTFQPGSPVMALFDSFGPEAAAEVQKTFITAVATGQGPRVIARAIRDTLGEPLTRTLTIARTETIRAYREASIASYAENDDVVSKWRWTATKSTRTCAMCLAMDGQEFDLSTPFGSHPCCRCQAIPVTKSWEELGITGVRETRPTIETGQNWFDRQTQAEQEKILGPAKFELFERGEIRISDLVGYRDDPKWGPSRFERSVKSLAGDS